MILHALPGGGKYSVDHHYNGVLIYLDMSRSCTRRVQAELQELVRTFFESGKVRTFRLPPRESRLPRFMPRIEICERATHLLFPDGSYIVVNSEGAYPWSPCGGQEGFVQGKKRNTYQADRFFSRIGEERAKAAIERWASGGALEVEDRRRDQ